MNPLCIAVAYSGGRDSTALLHATLQAAQASGLRVAALHVHHGLSAHADAWLAHAQRQCEAWAAQGLPVQLQHHRLTDKPARGDSVEAWARRERYAALACMAQAVGASLVLLAHHRRDQAETWLLQALRGAGAAGLSAMPDHIEREGLLWARPWLDRPREAIEAYVRAHGLQHIEDDSNSDPRHARNRLRLAVWPALVQAFPDSEAALADAARHAQEARECLDELARLDLAAVADDPGLRLDAWAALSPARRSNALRAWLRAQLPSAVPASLLDRLKHELLTDGEAAWPAPGGALHRHRGRLCFVADGTVPVAEREAALAITHAGPFALPGWGGTLHARHVTEGGVPLAWLAHLDLRAREGGERFQAGLGRPARSLKKQYQTADVPVWMRDGPLVFSGGQLVFVPGLGVDARVVGLPGQVQLTLDWIPGSAG